MKKKRPFFSSNYYWNKLVRKFYNLNNKIVKMISGKNVSNQEINYLVGRLKKLYKKLSRLQVRVGVKVAGSALALLLATSSLSAQEYNKVNNLKYGEYISQEWISPEFADVDNDGNVDLLIGTRHKGVLQYSITNNKYEFVDTLRYLGDVFTFDASKTTYEDLDGDGDLDLYVGMQQGYIVEMINDGTGNFSSYSLVLADGNPIEVNMFSAPVFEDIDNDGDLDLFVGEMEGFILQYENDGTNTFLAGDTVFADTVKFKAGYIAAPTFTDIDGDGDNDLIVGDYYGNITILDNDGSGNFSDAGYLQVDGGDFWSGYYASPAFADIDDDGDLDLYVGVYSYDTYMWSLLYFENDGNNVFTSGNNVIARMGDINRDEFTSVEFSDFDNDNDLDLFVGDWNTDFIYYYENIENNFLFVDTLQADGANIDLERANSVDLQDLDNDGDMDVYVGSYTGYIHVFLNDGSGVLTAGGVLQADGANIDVSGWCSPAFADIDNDSDIDLFVGDWYGNIRVFTNDGSNNFSSEGLLQVDGQNFRVRYWSVPLFADLDDDGDLDLFVGNYYGSVIQLKNDGDGNFSNLTNFMQSTELGAQPEFANLDGNCQPDLFVGKGTGVIEHYEYSDVIPPIPANPELPVVIEECSATLIPPTAVDNCDDVVTATTNDPVEYTEQGVHIVHWVYTDESGNSRIQTQTVVINDVTDPTITCLDDIVVEADASNTYTVSGTGFDLTDYADNCEVDTIYNSFNSAGSLDGEILDPGNYYVTWFVEDVAGNINYCSMNILVNQYVGTQNIDELNISVFPNPTVGMLNITNATGYNIEITDIQGKTTKTIFDVQDDNLQIDLSEQASGVYFVKIFNDEQIRIIKIVVE